MSARVAGILLLSTFITAGRVHAQVGPEPRRFTLENGLKVILAPDPSAQQTCVLLRYAAGSRDDPRGYQGLAHVTEHMTFRAGSSIEELQSIGATATNGVTTFDETYYYAAVPPPALARSLWLEARRMAFAAADMPEQEFDTERRVVLREWSEHCDSAFDELARELMQRVYAKSSHNAPWCDEPDDLRAMKLDHVRWFTQTHYRPERATLAVTGALDVAAAEALVRRYFSDIRGTGPAAPRVELRSASIDRPASIRHRKDARHDVLVLLWLLPGSRDERSTLYELSAEVLSRRLKEQLVDPPGGTASSAYAQLWQREVQSMLFLEVIARSDEEAEQLRDQVDTIITELKDGVLPNAVFQAARWGMWSERASSRESLAARALALARGRDASPARVLSVTPAEIQSAFRSWLLPERRVEGVYEGTSQ